MPEQIEFMPFSRRLYETARRYVRPAKRNRRRHVDVCTCLELFPERSAWRQAVSVVCRAYEIETQPAPSASVRFLLTGQ